MNRLSGRYARCWGKGHRTVCLVPFPGPLMVKAALESGRPTIVGGAGNCPAIVDETADVQLTVASILASKTFDNGMICASENSVVVVASLYNALLAEFSKRGAVLLSAEDASALAPHIVHAGSVNIDIVGRTAFEIAHLVPGLTARNPQVTHGSRSLCTRGVQQATPTSSTGILTLPRSRPPHASSSAKRQWLATQNHGLTKSSRRF